MDTDAGVIEREITIAASPRTVFKLLTDPDQYVRWKGRLAELDARPRGRYRVDLGDAGIVSGEYTEVIPFRRVVFTWGWEGNAGVPPGSTTVEIDLEPYVGGTKLHLIHRGVPAAARGSHTEGWDHFLPRLIAVAEGRTPEH